MSRSGGRPATIWALALTLVVAGCATVVPPQGGSAPPETRAPSPRADPLLDSLRKGGLVVIFRHAATDRSDPDQEPVDLSDCSTQRLLSEEGRNDARQIGAAFHDLQIPVGPVWSSPYCRAIDTAELAFGEGEVVPGLELLYPVRDDEADEQLNGLIREVVTGLSGQNLIIASHGVYPSVLSPAVTLAEGEAAVYRVQGDVVELLDRVLPEQWATLADAQATASQRATVETVLESIVLVESPSGGTGTGFRVASPGLIVTAASVIGSAETVEITTEDGRVLSAEVLGASPDLDIAALRVMGDDLPALHSGSGFAHAQVGDSVRAVEYDTDPALPWSQLSSLAGPGPVINGAVLPLVVFTGGTATAGTPVVDSAGFVLGVVSTALADYASGQLAAVPVGAVRDEALAFAAAS